MTKLKLGFRSLRERALLQSDIDFEHPLGRYFVEHFKGDPSDVDALKVEAQRLGVPFKQYQAT